MVHIGFMCFAVLLIPPVSSAWPTGCGHQRTQAGDGEEGGVFAAEPGSPRARAERHTEGSVRQKQAGQEDRKGQICDDCHQHEETVCSLVALHCISFSACVL